MATYNFGVVALNPNGTASHVLGFAVARTSSVASLFEVWDGPNNTDCVFAVRTDGQDQAIGDVMLGDPRSPADLATTATRGFLGIRVCNGPPTGTPADLGSSNAALVYDRANHRLYVYNGAWRYATLV